MKKILMSILALVLVVGAGAFMEKDNSRMVGEKWFVFVGSDASNATQLADPLNYELDGDGSMPGECQSNSLPYRCEIKITPQVISGVERPDFSQQVIGETKKLNVN